MSFYQALASARYAVATSCRSLADASVTAPVTGKALLRCSIASASLPLPPSRLTKRRNYLRLKLLKTLKKPHPGTVTPTAPQEPAEKPVSQVEELEFESELSGDQNRQDSTDQILKNYIVSPVEEFDASCSHANESNSIVEASSSKLGRHSASNVVRFGVYFAGMFVVLAFVRAVVVALGDFDEERRNARNGEEVKLNGIGYNNRYGFGGKTGMIHGQLLHLDEAEMEAKIAQIQVMAREARDSERKSSGNSDSGLNDVEDADNGEDIDDETEDDSLQVRRGIEKEVDGRLSRVSKRLNLEKSPLLNVNFLNKPLYAAEKGMRGVLGKEEEGKKLMFKKRYKFRSTISPNELSDKPKGFGGSDLVASSESVSGEKRSRLLKKSQKVENQNGYVQGESSAALDDADVTKDVESQTGVAQGFSSEKTLNEAIKRKTPSNLDPQIILNRGEDKHVALQGNGKSRTRRAGIEQSTSRISDKHPNNNSDLWWQNLPYLLAILMQDGSKDKSRGFYTLDNAWDASIQTEQVSYTVLFEDQNDARNFCHVLESFFEELDDVRVLVIPLSIKILKDAIDSRTIKVIVVRKGQLKLYAGQPLADVETALRSLVK